VSVPDGEYVAVLDRFEEGPDADRPLAVLVCERDGETVGDLVVAHVAVPQPGRHVDAVLDVTVEDGELVAADYRPEETERRKESAQSRFDRLSRRPGEDDEAS
jgi:hypothetical protein